VKFLNERAFATPAFLLNPEILRRVEPTGSLDRVRAAHARAQQPASTTRVARMVELGAIDGASAYQPATFLGDGARLWAELAGASVKTIRIAATASVRGSTSPRRASRRRPTRRVLFRGELKTLDVELRLALPRAGDAATRRHLDDARAQIAQALDPSRPAPATPAVRTGFPGIDEAPDVPQSCWPIWP
jgi:hypothetical protein